MKAARHHPIMKAAELFLYSVAILVASQSPGRAGESASSNATPAFKARLTFTFGADHPGASSTIALVGPVTSGTNTVSLPEGSRDFFFYFEGHRHGMDIWNVGERFTGDGKNKVMIKRIRYEGKRVGADLMQGAHAVLDPWTGERQAVQPGGAANGSQPIRSETNSTSPAAGSRR